MTTDYERVRSAVIYLAENAERQPGLDEIAAHVGLSGPHFQRMFTRWAGISPKRFLQHLTVARAKRLLSDSAPVLDAALEVGLSGSGRLHDLMVTTEGMTPGEFRRAGEGIEIRWGTGATPFGEALVATTPRGVCALRFVDAQSERDAVDHLDRTWRAACFTRDDDEAASTLSKIFDSDGPHSTPLDVRGTNFQLRVWEALLLVPEGRVISYSHLADRLGMPTASRAVANAVGANPVAYLIPCHRVLRANGELGGYRWGTDRKLVMLERELAERESEAS